MTQKRVPLILVLGFLGSGKTSFIKHFLEETGKDFKTGIVQNDFAPAGIDAEILRTENSKLNILEINGGSLFCVCRMETFIPTLSDFIERESPELLLLEASGMSDPMSLAEILNASELNDRIYLEGVVTIADAVNFEKISSLNNRIREQIRMADIILVNKSDMVSDDALLKCEDNAQNLNPEATIKATRFGNPGFSIMNFFETLNNPKYSVLDAAAPSSPSGLKTAVIRSNRSISTENLNLFLEEWRDKLIRMKGFIKMQTGGFKLLNLTYSEISLSDISNYNGPSTIIAIGEQYPDPKIFSKSFRSFSAS